MTKRSHRFLSVFLALILALALAVPALAAEPVKVTGVSLDKTEAALSPGEMLSLNATVMPLDATNRKVTWKSNQTAVADVKDGVVTAKSVGTADITVTTSDGSYSAVCKITVEENYVTGLSITPAGPETVPVGKTRQLTANVAYAHAPAGSQEVTWSSNSPEIASVNPQGLVTAHAVGQTDIIAVTRATGLDGTPMNAIYHLTVSESLGGTIPRTSSSSPGPRRPTRAA